MAKKRGLAFSKNGIPYIIINNPNTTTSNIGGATKTEKGIFEKLFGGGKKAKSKGLVKNKDVPKVIVGGGVIAGAAIIAWLLWPRKTPEPEIAPLPEPTDNINTGGYQSPEGWRYIPPGDISIGEQQTPKNLIEIITGLLYPQPAGSGDGSGNGGGGGGNTPDTCPEGFHMENGLCLQNTNNDDIDLDLDDVFGDGGDYEIPCYPGYHKDTTTGNCVPDQVTTCPTGYHLINGVCVQDTPTCPTGYHLVNGVCVQDSNNDDDNNDDDTTTLPPNSFPSGMKITKKSGRCYTLEFNNSGFKYGEKAKVNWYKKLPTASSTPYATDTEKIDDAVDHIQTCVPSGITRVKVEIKSTVKDKVLIGEFNVT